MRVLICGGRDYNDQDFFDREMDRISMSLEQTLFVIQGGATGADQLARGWAAERIIPYCTFPANWDRLDKAAGPIRNEWMLQYGKPDLVIAFPGGDGTKGMAALAEAAGVEVRRIRW